MASLSKRYNPDTPEGTLIGDWSTSVREANARTDEARTHMIDATRAFAALAKKKGREKAIAQMEIDGVPWPKTLRGKDISGDARKDELDAMMWVDRGGCETYLAPDQSGGKKASKFKNLQPENLYGKWSADGHMHQVLAGSFRKAVTAEYRKKVVDHFKETENETEAAQIVIPLFKLETAHDWIDAEKNRGSEMAKRLALVTKAITLKKKRAADNPDMLEKMEKFFGPEIKELERAATKAAEIKEMKTQTAEEAKQKVADYIKETGMEDLK